MSVEVSRSEDGRLTITATRTVEGEPKTTTIAVTDDEARRMGDQLRAHTIDPMSKHARHTTT